MANFAADDTFASLCWTEVKVPTQNKKAAKVFCEGKKPRNILKTDLTSSVMAAMSFIFVFFS